MKYAFARVALCAVPFLSPSAFSEDKNKDLAKIGSFLSGNLLYIASGHILYKEYPGEFNDDLGWANGLVQLHAGHLLSKELVIPELKKAIDRDRPNGASGAFPSGHAGTAFFPAWSIYHRYGMEEAWPYLVGATIAGYARVENKHHDWLDIAGSAGVTYVLSRYLVSPQDEPDQPKIGVGFSADGAWLNFSMKW